MARVVYPMTIQVALGPQIVLTRVEPKESALEFNDEIAQAAQSSVQQVGGDGERKPHWKAFDTWLETPDRPSARAAILAEFESGLRSAIRANIDGLIYPITRIRVISRTPYATGYRLGMQMIGPYSDFITSTESPILAPLW